MPGVLAFLFNQQEVNELAPAFQRDAIGAQRQAPLHFAAQADAHTDPIGKHVLVMIL